jgi:hypothetical protein
MQSTNSGAAPATVGQTTLFESTGSFYTLPGRETAANDGKPGDRPEARNLRIPDRIVSEGGRSCMVSRFSIPLTATIYVFFSLNLP